MSIDWSLLAADALQGPHRLAAALQRLIEDDRPAPGTRFPAERDLAARLGVSRASVREALRELELRGLVDRRPGRGTVVTGPMRPDLRAHQLGDMSAASRLAYEVMDLRAAVEPPVAARAAARATDADVQRLADLLARARAAHGRGDLAQVVRLDGQFHVAVAEAAHNPLLTRLLEVTNAWVEPSRDPGYQTADRLTASLRAHRRVLSAIGAHEAEQAEQAMADHLSEVRQAIAGALTSPPPRRRPA